MLTDEQYGRRIGDRLRHEVDDVRAAPDLIRKLRRQQSRRTWTITGAIATPVAAAAVILITTTGQGVPAQQPAPVAAPPSSTTTSSAPPQVQNVAYVQAQTVKALGEAAQYIIYSKDTYESGYYETWIDKATRRYRNDVYTRLPAPDPNQRPHADGTVRMPPATKIELGPPHRQQSHAVKRLDGEEEMVTVDYERRTWSVNRMKDSEPPANAIPDPSDPEAMRKAVADGTLELLGQEKVNGIDTLHLRLIGPKREYKIEIWVDGTSYLPVKETAIKSAGGKGDKEFPESHGEAVSYAWLPRTEQNLALLTLTPPPDFQHVK